MKQIRYNVPKASEKKEFGDSENYTLHTNGVTVYFDTIEEGAGYLFLKNGERVAYVPEEECEVSPKAAKRVAEDSPNEKVPFDD